MSREIISVKVGMIVNSLQSAEYSESRRKHVGGFRSIGGIQCRQGR